MLTALKLLGLSLLGGAVLLVLGIVLLVWFVRRWFRRAIQQEQSFIPCRLTLEAEQQPQWKTASDVERYSKDLRQLGFQEIGAFQIPELRGLLVRGFYHAAEPAYAIIYDHLQIPPNVDIVRKFTDGFSVSATNTALGSNLDQRPNTKTFWLAQASMQELFKAVTSHQHEGTPVEHSPENFVAGFQRAYYESMAWRLKRGGVTKEEIRREAAHMGKDFSEEQLKEAWQTHRQQYRRQVHEGCIGQYLDDNKTAAPEWDRISDRVIVLAETYELNDIIESLDSHLVLDEEQRHVLEKLQTSFGDTGLTIAESILSNNLAGLNLNKLGQVQEPVPALLLLTPDPALSAQAA